MFKFPCEIVMQFVLPAMRKEMVVYFAEKKNLKQKEIAKILGITDAAVSQYIRGKRGAMFAFDRKLQKKIHKMCDKLLLHYQKHGEKHKGSEFMVDACAICQEVRYSKKLCNLHNEHNFDIGNCKACRGL